MDKFLVVILLFGSFCSFSQDHDFPFGEVTAGELKMSTYEKDTMASAFFIREFGEAYISEATYNLIFVYHAKIKILKNAGLDIANLEIPLRKNGSTVETLTDLKAASFNMEDGKIKEVSINRKNIFTEEVNKYRTIKKIAIPNVRVGSVVEISYTLESPFLYNFRQWNFQSQYPKKISEYWATIPANYIYNISLTGYLKLSTNESNVVRHCLHGGGGSASCARFRYTMENIPAFYEEDYMTASSNFISAIKFELSEINHFDGRKDKVTKSWKDAEIEIMTDENFGAQLRKGKGVFDAYIDTLIDDVVDPQLKVKRIYNFIRSTFRWDELLGKYSELGIKKALEAQRGNVGDINLSLIAALRYAGFEADPVLLSTRENGFVSMLYPVLSEFNYVIARVVVGNEVYLLDATEDFYPFGLLPERCLNGKGRVFGADSSYWIDINATQRDKHVTMLRANLDEKGVIHGTLSTTYTGYAAVRKRQRILSYANEQEYFSYLTKNLVGYEIGTTTITHLHEIDEPLVQNIEFTINAFDGNEQTYLLNTFPLEKWAQNPFQSNERHFPVDFGAALEEIFVVELSYDSAFEITNIPEKVALALPNNGGRFIVDPKPAENKIIMSLFLSILKPVYSPVEYHYLKELFSRIVQVHQNDLVIHRK